MGSMMLGHPRKWIALRASRVPSLETQVHEGGSFVMTRCWTYMWQGLQVFGAEDCEAIGSASARQDSTS